MKRLNVLLFCFALTGASSYGSSMFNAPTVSQEEKNEWLSAIDAEDLTDFGFVSTDEIKNAKLGKGMPLTTWADDFAHKSGDMIDPIHKYLYPITIAGEIRSLLIVSRNDTVDQFAVESIGHSKLAKSLAAYATERGSLLGNLVLVHDLELKRHLVIENFDAITGGFSNTNVRFLPLQRPTADQGQLSTMTVGEYIDTFYGETSAEAHQRPNYGEIGHDSENTAAPLALGQDEELEKECKSKYIKESKIRTKKSKAKKDARTRWRNAVKKKYSSSWADLDLAKDKKESCKKKDGKYECKIKAKPCKKKKKKKEKKKEKNLHVDNYRQQQSNWCWAAATQTIVNYYNRQRARRQCEIVNHGLGRKDCCQEELPKECNKPNNHSKTIEVMKRYKVNGSSVGALSFDKVKQQIDKSRPGQLSWKYGKKNVGHRVSFSGYKDEKVDKIRIKDPSKGSSWMAYDKAKKSGKRFWRASITTR